MALRAISSADRTFTDQSNIAWKWSSNGLGYGLDSCNTFAKIKYQKQVIWSFLLE